ncbi:MAG: YihY/virulence factor BrkB family protein [Anaerolineae bacterium]
MSQIKDRLNTLYEQANRRTGGVLTEIARQRVTNFVTQVIPISQELIRNNIQSVLELRGSVGIIGLVGLLWAASGAFAVLSHNINRAWEEAETRGFLGKRLVALGMIAALAALLILSLISSAALNLLPEMEIPIGGGISVYQTFLWTLISNLVPMVFTFVMFLALYRWVPNTLVDWKAALWGAGVASVGWEIAKRAFTWYLGSGLVRYELIYGSLGTVVALLFWIYLSSLITLFGAHLCATIDKKAS